MRTDELIAAAFDDPRDIRALLLGTGHSGVRPLYAFVKVEPAETRDALALAIERLSAKVIGEDRSGAPFLQLSLWGATRLGADRIPQDLSEADREIVALSPGVPSAPAQEGEIFETDEARLLKIAIVLAHLRHKRQARLRGWRGLLDRLIGTEGVPGERPVTVESPPALQPHPAPQGDAGWSNEALWDAIKAAGSRLPLSVWEERLDEARKALGRFNIIVAGRTGVGKTTLIGAIFGEEVGNTLMGRPRTRGRLWYPADPGEADVLRLCDTEGLEMERYEETLNGLKREIASRNSSNDPFDHIHVAWLCIDEPSLTVQPGEEALVELLTDEGIPVIAVLTKAGMAPSFRETVKEILPKAQAVIRVRAAPIEIEGQTFATTGLRELMEVTEQVIPRSVEAAWNVASRNLEANLRRCELRVRQAAAAAGAAGAAPIPLADAAGVFGVQVGMIVSVSLNMGVKLERSDLRAMAVTLIGALGLTAGGRFIAGQVAKLVPGIGTIAGSAMTGTTAAAITYGLGRAYIEYLRGFFEKNQRMPDADELTSGFRHYWSQWKNKYEPPPPAPNS